MIQKLCGFEAFRQDWFLREGCGQFQPYKQEERCMQTCFIFFFFFFFYITHFYIEKQQYLQWREVKIEEASLGPIHVI